MPLSGFALPQGGSTRASAVSGALGTVLLAAFAAEHPGLRFVDAIGFAVRAEALPATVTLGNRLYPLGYPVALRLGYALTGDVLVAGKALAALAGGLVVGAVARALGVGAGLAVLASAVSLQWGATEGTDMAAAALGIAGLMAACSAREAHVAQRATSTRLSALAGAFAAAACLTRYTAAPQALLVLLLAPRRLHALAPLLVAAGVHVAGAWLAGVSPIPDQSENLRIGAGPSGGPGPAPAPIARWLTGMTRTLGIALAEWPARIGAVGLVVGAWRRDRRAWALVAALLAHSALLGLAFGNPRLALPATLAALAGAAWLVPWTRLLVPLAVLGIAVAAPAARAPDPVATSADTLARSLRAEGLTGPVASTSAWVHLRRDDGWLAGALPLTSFTRDVRALTPDTLGDALASAGVPLLVIDVTRLNREYPRLRPAYEGTAVGWTRVGKANGMRALTRDGVMPGPWDPVRAASVVPGAPPPR